MQPHYFFKRLIGLPVSEIPHREIAALLPDNPVIIEAGTSNGSDTLTFCNSFPKGMIFGVEPIPHLFQSAKNLLKDSPNCSLHNLALVGQEIEKVFMNTDVEGHDSSSVLNPTRHLSVYPDVKYNQKIEVDARTIDQFCDENRIQKIDLLWLDLQGLELDVLKNGATRMLPRTRYLHLEVSRIELYEGSGIARDVIRFMKNEGFRELISRYPFVSGNILFENKNEDLS